MMEIKKLLNFTNAALYACKTDQEVYEFNCPICGSANARSTICGANTLAALCPKCQTKINIVLDPQKPK